MGSRSTPKTTKTSSSELLSQFQTSLSDRSKNPLLLFSSRSHSLTSHGSSGWYQRSSSPRFPQSNSTQKTTKTSSSELLSQCQRLLSDRSKNPRAILFQKPFSHLPRVFWLVDTCSQRSPSPRFPQSNSTQKTTKTSSSELLSQCQRLLSDRSKNPRPILFQKPFSHLPRVFWLVDTCSQRSPSPRFPQSNSTLKTIQNSSSELLSQCQTLLSDGSERFIFTAIFRLSLSLDSTSWTATEAHSLPRLPPISSATLRDCQTLLSDGRIEQCCSALFGDPDDLLRRSGGPPAITAGRVGLVRFAPARKAVCAPSQRHI